MAKYLLTLSAGALTLLSLAPLAPAAAQQGTRIREIEVFGNDPCPRSTDSEIFVCARKNDPGRVALGIGIASDSRSRTSGSKTTPARRSD